MDATNELLLTDVEAAKLLRMLRTRLLRLARRGEVPHVLLPDGEIRFDANDLRAWVEHFKQPTTNRQPAECQEVSQ